MRLDKYICQSTTMTRSQAKKVIAQGRISNTENVIRSTAYKVSENEAISFDGKLINVRSTRYIMLNKPKDYICSTVDEQLPSIINLIEVDKAEQLFIAGRVDADTTGLALIPLALKGDEPGSEIQSPMAVVILGGLLSATILNLVVIPCV